MGSFFLKNLNYFIKCTNLCNHIEIYLANDLPLIVKYNVASLGAIKLGLAQYREMAAFAQFGSDLDASTQQLLNRGAKLTELLKQDQYSPMTVAEQVISVFTGVKGYLDDIEIGKIKQFENDIIEKIKSEKPEIIESILSSGKLEEETEKLVIQVIEEYKKGNK